MKNVNLDLVIISLVCILIGMLLFNCMNTNERYSASTHICQSVKSQLRATRYIQNGVLYPGNVNVLYSSWATCFPNNEFKIGKRCKLEPQSGALLVKLSDKL